MKQSKMIKTDLVCLECGNVDTIMRHLFKQKKVSHIKDLWCYKCKKTTKHYEIRDLASFMLYHPGNEQIKELIKNGKFKDEEEKYRIFKKVLAK